MKRSWNYSEVEDTVNNGSLANFSSAVDGFSSDESPPVKKIKVTDVMTPLHVFPAEVWQTIFKDQSDPREIENLCLASSQFYSILAPRTLSFLINADFNSNTERVTWQLVKNQCKTFGQYVWRLKISFSDFSQDFYKNFMECISLTPNLKAISLFEVGKNFTSKELAGPHLQGDFKNVAWKPDDIWQYIEDYPPPSLPNLTHLDLDVNEDVVEFLAVSVIPYYGRQLVKLECRQIPIWKGLNPSFIADTGIVKNLNELHLKDVQSIYSLEELMLRIRQVNPPLLKLHLSLSRPTSILNLLEILVSFQIKDLEISEFVNGAALYEIRQRGLPVNPPLKNRTVPSVETLTIKDSRYLTYEFLHYLPSLQSLKIEECPIVKAKYQHAQKYELLKSAIIASELRKCIYEDKAGESEIWNILVSLSNLRVVNKSAK